MGNVLVLDTSNVTSHLIRAILKGRGHGVSISSSFKDAIQKIETGLFDAMFFDVPQYSEEAEGFLNRLSEILPGFPIILVGTSLPNKDKFFANVERPLRMRSIINAAAQAISHINSLKDRRKFLRRGVDVTVEVSSNSETLACKAVNMSLGGVQVVSWSNEITHMIGFDNFFQRECDKVLSTTLFMPSEPLQLKTRVAYLEKNPIEIITSAGLSFPDLPDETRSAVAAYLAGTCDRMVTT